MNTRSLPLILTLVLPVLLAGCVVAVGSGCGLHTVLGSSVEKTESRVVGDFKRIEVRGSADVDVALGAPTSVTVSGDENVLPFLRTEVRGDTLVIGLKDGSFKLRHPLKVAVTAPALAGVEIAGSADVDVRGLRGERFDASIAGSGNLTAEGEVGRLDVSIAGSGDVKLFDLQARDVAIDIAGSGDARVSASSALDVSIAGSGDVRYRGEPKVAKSIAGSGRVARE